MTSSDAPRPSATAQSKDPRKPQVARARFMPGSDTLVCRARTTRILPANPAETEVLQCNTREKFLDHQTSKPRFQLIVGMKSHRQSDIYAREGVELDRSTLADWVGGTSQLFEPLVETLRRHVMGAQKLHADDAPVPVSAPGNGKTKIGRLWTYVRDDRPARDQTPPPDMVRLHAGSQGGTPTGTREQVQGHVSSRCLDAYAGFEKTYERGRNQEATCWPTCAPSRQNPLTFQSVPRSSATVSDMDTEHSKFKHAWRYRGQILSRWVTPWVASSTTKATCHGAPVAQLRYGLDPAGAGIG